MIAKDGGVLSFYDILDFVNRCRCDIPNSLDMFGNEQEMVGIDVAVVDEATGLLWAATGIGRVYQSTLIVHEVVEITNGHDLNIDGSCPAVISSTSAAN